MYIFIEPFPHKVDGTQDPYLNVIQIFPFPRPVVLPKLKNVVFFIIYP